MKTSSIYSRLSHQARIRLAAFLNAVVVSLGADVPLEATTRTWDGSAGDANWTSNLNWTPSGNVANDDLIFPGDGAQPVNTNDFDVNTNFNSLTIKRGNYVISGHQIFLANGINADFTQGPELDGTFNPNIVLGGNQTWTSGFARLTLNGVVNLNNFKLTVTGTNGGLGFILNGLINGTGTLAKTGNGRLTIAGTANGFGATNLTGGDIVVTGDLGAVNLQGGTLRGTGTVAGITGTGGTIDPGIVSPDTAVLTSTDVVSLNSATTLKIDVNGSTPGTQLDQLVVTGKNVFLGNANLNFFVRSTFNPGPTVGQQFTIVSQTGVGSIFGKFAQGDFTTPQGRIFSINYMPDKVVLTFEGTELAWDGGGGNNNWSNASNWDFDFAPSNNSVSLVFPAGVPADSKNQTNDIGGLALSKITFSGNDYGIGGNFIGLSGGILTTVATGVGNTLGVNINFAQSQTFLNTGDTTTNIGGQVNLDDKTLTIDGSGNHGFSGAIIGNAPIGQGGIVKNGTGQLFLPGSNTYTGLTLINNGVVHISNPSSLGATNATGSVNHTIVASGASLILETNVTLNDESISLNGTGFGTVGGALSVAGCNPGCTATGIGPATDSTINIPFNNNRLTLAGPISGSAGLTKIGPGTLVLSGNSPNYTGTVTVTAGTLLVTGNYTKSPVNITGGTVGGTGPVGGVTTTHAAIAPGESAGTLNSLGDVFFNPPGSVYRVEIGGTVAGAEHDKLNVTGRVQLGDGTTTLEGTLINGFVPTPGQSFIIIQATGGLTGTFVQGSAVNIGGNLFAIGYTSSSVVLTAQGGPSPTPTATATATATATPTATATATPVASATATPTATPSATPVTTLANISTRLRVETGDNVLIGGFILTGTQPKKVIVRGIGTSLALADKLENPTLELHGPLGLIESNDNWVDSPNKQAIIDSTIPPTSDLESAIVATLPANGTGYTAIVRGVNNSTGIGVVEAFDLDTQADSELANISTRGFVQTGDNVLIAGTIIVGQTTQRILVRGIGPSLTIDGKMADPTLELRDANGVLLKANDDWIDSPDKQDIIDTTIPPTNNLESAIVATLPSNAASYTAILRGANNTTGIAVVEIYGLP